MHRDQIRQKLQELRHSLEQPFAAAKAAGDTADMERLTQLAVETDDLLDELALIDLRLLAQSLADITARINHRTVEAGTAARLESMTFAGLREEVGRIFEASDEDAATAAPAAAPMPTPRPLLSDTVAVAAPVETGDGRLMLTEAHLLALWKRSLFPIDDRGIIVFGLRGCQPVSTTSMQFAAGHEIQMTPVNFKTMNCAIGQWRPGAGLALFHGSTVPFGATVERLLSANGVGVNQLGRGRYSNYQAGWHKRSEGSGGHWALLQECAITIQRTGDDLDFDLLDRWEVGKIAGDNIHCAFHMGAEGDRANARFSSAGCQVVAGTVKKGVRGSAAGPWKRFIEPFESALGKQRSAEYSLFGADEVQDMIRNAVRDRSVVLRFGSKGSQVEALQTALNRRLGRSIGVDGDFGRTTFLAVIDFQTEVFGPDADDGIVGSETAEKLGFELPGFDFDDAIAGRSGVSGVTAGADSGVLPALAPTAAASLTGAPKLRLTKADWQGVFPKAPDAVIEAFTNAPGPLDEAGITQTRTRLAYALANVEHECNGFKIRNLTESIKYSAKRMAEVWPNRFSSARNVKQKFGTARGWQKKAFDEIYGERMGNRPGTNDGSTYLGRGGPQITGRDGYRKVGRLAGLDLENNPELASMPEHQPAILAAFWKWKKLNRHADKGNFSACVKTWNGGTNGMADRNAKLDGNDPIISRLTLVTTILPHLDV